MRYVFISVVLISLVVTPISRLPVATGPVELQLNTGSG